MPDHARYRRDRDFDIGRTVRELRDGGGDISRPDPIASDLDTLPRRAQRHGNSQAH
jgi:hypothetical protein